MKFIINENIEQTIINDLLVESFNPSAEKVLLVKDFLDKNFERKKDYLNDIGSDGYPIKKSVINMISNGQVLKTFESGDEMLMLLDDKFHNIIVDTEDRKKFLTQVLIDWYNNKITKNGLLSVNTIK